MEKPILEVTLNGGHIEVYKHSVIFYDDEREETWECGWKEIYKLTDGGSNL